MDIMDNFTPYLKAITAALIAGLGTLSLALEDGHVAANEWVNVVLSALVALGGVAAVPNLVHGVNVQKAGREAIARSEQGRHEL